MTTPSNSLVTQSAQGRGERLYPPRHSRVYWCLTALREAYQTAIDQNLSLPEDAILVDYGCGNMPYRSLFTKGKYFGADLPGNELADIEIQPTGELPLPDNYASVVLSSQVLEHVENVDLYLSEAARILHDGGLLFLSTHGVWKYHPDPCDFWRWTCDGLKHIVSKSGFEVVHFEGVMGPEATALQLWQDIVINRVPKQVRHIFTRYMQWRIKIADKKCDKISRNKDACVYVLVARKI